MKGETLAVLGQTLKLGDFLHLGAGEVKNGGATRASTLADALEAIFGAVFLDGGFDQAKQVILHVYTEQLEQLSLESTHSSDAKTELQEYMQAQKMPLPHYKLIKTEGEDHAQQFHIACRIETLNLAEKGTGKTRRKAEQQAAAALLAHLKKLKK